MLNDISNSFSPIQNQNFSATEAVTAFSNSHDTLEVISPSIDPESLTDSNAIPSLAHQRWYKLRSWILYVIFLTISCITAYNTYRMNKSGGNLTSAMSVIIGACDSGGPNGTAGMDCVRMNHTFV